MKKTDRRVQRTTRLLRDALIDLSLERGYDSVTIQDITDHANLGRATFYLHYRDKDELLLSTLQEIVDDLLARVSPEVAGMFMYGETSPILIIFRHAEEHQDLYRIILRGRGAASVDRQLREFAATATRSHIEAVLGHKPSPLPIEIAANYFANSLLGMVEWWLDNDMPYPADYMAQAFYELGVTGTLKALGLENKPELNHGTTNKA